MTFEEIYQRIEAGVPISSREQVEEELDLLTRYDRRAPVMVAVDIAEARQFRSNDRDFWKDAQAAWKFPGKKTIFHYFAVGMLLMELRDFNGGKDQEKENRSLELQARKSYQLCLGIGLGKLHKLTVLKKKRGVVEVMNFLKIHYTPDLSTPDFIALIDQLYGTGDKSVASEALTFKVDIFDDVEEASVEKVFARDVGAAQAMQIVSNSSLICRYAARQLADHADDFSPAALSEFERLSAELDEAKRHLDAVITMRRREALALN